MIGEQEIMLAALGCCLMLSFFLSGMEAGLFEVSRLRLRRLMREGNRRARRLNGYLEDSEDCLWTVLIGNTLANLGAVVLALALLQRWLLESDPPTSRLVLFWAFFGIGGLLFFTFCELLPKMLFRRHPNRLCLLLSRPFSWVHMMMKPVVALSRGVARLLLGWTGRGRTTRLFGNRDEMRQAMHEASQDITADERVMIDRVLDMQNIPVRDVAVPLDGDRRVMLHTPVRELLPAAETGPLLRLPVWRQEDGRTRVAGVINLRNVVFLQEKDLGKPAGDFLESALFLDEEVRLESLLRLMRRSGQRVVIILDRNRNELGIVTLPDILKVVFGEVKV